jgi:hypothetical protein
MTKGAIAYKSPLRQMTQDDVHLSLWNDSDFLRFDHLSKQVDYRTVYTCPFRDSRSLLAAPMRPRIQPIG